MVKKVLPNGEECPKCQDATRILKRRGYWDRITRTVFAVPGEPDNEGVRLAKEHGMTRAPFFVVGENSNARACGSVLQLIHEVFEKEKGRGSEGK